ncbi:hypothetical protein BDQ12DRAFT_727178 [Crucibulum laeve]|uniref:Uncharacterized protein n=1 Tax=Crucibulum laeve TaxID=68775 RepID=A0A5C3LNF9_9AGAR|nr:hypothetical protein BDQ12DRAFT_727178 [Crucibulum laeve]
MQSEEAFFDSEGSKPQNPPTSHLGAATLLKNQLLSMNQHLDKVNINALSVQNEIHHIHKGMSSWERKWTTNTDNAASNLARNTELRTIRTHNAAIEMDGKLIYPEWIIELGELPATVESAEYTHTVSNIFPEETQVGPIVETMETSSVQPTTSTKTSISADLMTESVDFQEPSIPAETQVSQPQIDISAFSNDQLSNIESVQLLVAKLSCLNDIIYNTHEMLSNLWRRFLAGTQKVEETYCEMLQLSYSYGVLATMRMHNASISLQERLVYPPWVEVEMRARGLPISKQDAINVAGEFLLSYH